jgi:cytochrome c
MTLSRRITTESGKQEFNMTKQGRCANPAAAFLTTLVIAILVAGTGRTLAADAVAGQQVFRKVCMTCHSTEKGVNKTGPSLFGVYGRTAGTAEFPRYKGLVGADFSWDAVLLEEYLQDPKAFVLARTQNKTTAMTYSLKDPQLRADVIAFVQTLK